MPEVIFNGADGRLEGRYHHDPRANSPLALILPASAAWRTMNNKVVYDLFHMFVRRGFSVLRFNFRGVGRSQESFDHGQGELRDAAAALDWMQQHNQQQQLLGRRFLVRRLDRHAAADARPEIHGFLSIALPANMYDFSFLAPCPSSGLIVHGGNDSLVPQESVAKLVQKLSQQRGIKIDLEVIPAPITSSAGISPSSAGRSSATTPRSARRPRPRWRKPADEPPPLGVRPPAGRRGFVHQATDLEAIDARAAEGRLTAYIGFDCTADSLHVGNLVGIMMLRWLQRPGIVRSR